MEKITTKKLKNITVLAIILLLTDLLLTGSIGIFYSLFLAMYGLRTINKKDFEATRIVLYFMFVPVILSVWALIKTYLLS